MLRRADNVQIKYVQPRLGMFLNKPKPGSAVVYVFVGKQIYNYPNTSPEQWNGWLHQQLTWPILFRVGAPPRNYWWFQNAWHWDNENLSAEQIHALLITKQKRRSHEIERAQAMVAMGMRPTQTARRAIPKDVQQYVWQRDRGTCQNCGSTSELQFDHVISVAYGGGSTPENLQLLCGPCNRRKSSGFG
jgi:hypothetical protein